jgi:glyoxylate/hydroxypyruvate reductase A
LGPLDFRTLKGGFGNAADVEVALAWKPDKGVLDSFKNLKLIVSLGMGVDHLLADNRVPEGVPVTRIMDDGLVGQMSEYAIYWALRHHRDIDQYAEPAARPEVEAARFRRHASTGGSASWAGYDRPGQPRESSRSWASRPPAGAGPPRACRASRRSTARRADDSSSAAATSLSRAAAHARDARHPDGKTVRPPAQGRLRDQHGRAAAMSSTTTCWRARLRRIRGAALDVFNTEPLPADHPYLDASQGAHHAAHGGLHQPAHASPGVIDNIKRLRAGQPLINRRPKSGISRAKARPAGEL